MRTFKLRRFEDLHGVSGTGVVAVGIEFPSGHCVIEWTTQFYSMGFYPNIEELEAIHGHKGATIVDWDDERGIRTCDMD